MASYWTRKDDASKELDTIKPWDELLGHGLMEHPLKCYDTVCALVLHGDKLLAVRNEDENDPDVSSRWMLPGSKMEPGDDAEMILKARIKETLNMEVTVNSRIVSMTYSYPDYDVRLQAFLCDSPTEKFSLREYAEARWIGREEQKLLSWCGIDEDVLNAWNQTVSVCDVEKR